MEHWFQNTRGLVIVVLAVITGAVLLAIEPGDGFPTGTSRSSGGDTTVTTTVTTVPKATTTTVAEPEIQEGTTNTAATTVLQQRLAQLGYTITVDGSFGSGTTTVVKEFQTNNGLDPTGVVDAATWAALVKTDAVGPSGATTTTAAQ